MNVAGLQNREKNAKQAKDMERERVELEEENKKQQQEIDDLNSRYLQAQQRMLEAKKKRADLEAARAEMSLKVEEIEKAELAPTEPCSTLTPRLGLHFDLEVFFSRMIRPAPAPEEAAERAAESEAVFKSSS